MGTGGRRIDRASGGWEPDDRRSEAKRAEYPPARGLAGVSQGANPNLLGYRRSRVSLVHAGCRRHHFRHIQRLPTRNCGAVGVRARGECCARSRVAQRARAGLALARRAAVSEPCQVRTGAPRPGRRQTTQPVHVAAR